MVRHGHKYFFKIFENTNTGCFKTSFNFQVLFISNGVHTIKKL